MDKYALARMQIVDHVNSVIEEAIADRSPVNLREMFEGVGQIILKASELGESQYQKLWKEAVSEISTSIGVDQGLCWLLAMYATRVLNVPRCALQIILFDIIASKIEGHKEERKE